MEAGPRQSLAPATPCTWTGVVATDKAMLPAVAGGCEMKQPGWAVQLASRWLSALYLLTVTLVAEAKRMASVALPKKNLFL